MLELVLKDFQRAKALVTFLECSKGKAETPIHDSIRELVT